MKILVPVKRVVDYNVRIQVKSDNSGVNLDGVKMSVNPFDEIAVEEALRIKERGEAEEVIAVTIGDSAAQEQLRTVLAMGCDRAILVEAPSDLEPLAVAKTLKALVEKEDAQLVIAGKQAIDDDSGQVAQMLAALLSCAQATFASKIELAGDSAKVTREVDAGLETIEVDLPAVVSADLRLNEPRYVKLPDIMKAKRKPIDTLSLAELGVDGTNQLTVSNWSAPSAREPGIKVEDVAGLVGKLKEKGLL